MMFDGAMPPMNPPGDVTVSVSPTCSTVVGWRESQSRWTTPRMMAPHPACLRSRPSRRRGAWRRRRSRLALGGSLRWVRDAPAPP